MHKSFLKVKRGDVVTIYSHKFFVGAVVTDIRYITYGDLKVQLFTLKKDGEILTYPHWNII